MIRLHSLTRAWLNLLNSFPLPVLYYIPGAYPLKSFLCRIAGIEVGQDVIITNGVKFHGKLTAIRLDDHVAVGLRTLFYAFSRITVGSFTRIAPGVTLSSSAPGKSLEVDSSKGLEIGRGVWIGAGATILGPLTIGDFAIIGAGSFVECDVPSAGVVVGVPGRLLYQRKVADKIWYMPGQYYDSKTFLLTSPPHA